MIILKSPTEIKIMERSNGIVHRILNCLVEKTRPGVTTMELEKISRELVAKSGARPAFLGYKGFSAALCTSVNEEVIHGIPSSKVLKEGDILSLDLGVLYEGYFGDAALTVPVGKISEKARKLIRVTKEALQKAVEYATVENRLSDISAAIQQHAEKHGFSVIRDFVGHGIGKELHEDPQIPNFGEPGKGPPLRAGMVLAIEPMISGGSWEVEVKPDGWTAVTRDRSLAAHFEYSVAVTEEGPLVLGLSSRI